MGVNNIFIKLNHQWITAIIFVGFVFIYFISSTSSSSSLENGPLTAVDEKNLSSHYVAPDLPDCKPPKKIAYVKTMRSASSTFYNMLLVYANKTNMIPQQMISNDVRSGPFNRTAHLVDPSLKGDIISDRFIWNQDEVLAHLGSDSVSFAVLRHPYEAFESYYSSFNLPQDNGVGIKEFIALLRKSNPKDWAHGAVPAGQIGMGFYHYGLALSMGLSVASLNDVDAIGKHIAKIEKELNFVLISDRMEESLILFRYLMCWKPDDIVVFDHNVRSKEVFVQLDEDDRNELKRWLTADLMIYNHFYTLFEERVAKYPGNMELEMKKRIHDREELRSDCILAHKNNPKCAGFNALEAGTRYNRI